MIKMTKTGEYNNDLTEHANGMALDFLVSTLTGDNSRACKLASSAISAGPDFILHFFSALYFHINSLASVVDHARPNFAKLLHKLCNELKVGNGVNFWVTYAIRKKLPDYKISKKAIDAGRKDDPMSYWKGKWR